MSTPPRVWELHDLHKLEVAYESQRAEQEHIIQRLKDGNEHHEELDGVEASSEGEVEVETVRENGDVEREGGGDVGEREITGKREDTRESEINGYRNGGNGSVIVTTDTNENA